MSEELYITVGPDGKTFKCVAAMLGKLPKGQDPFGRPLSKTLVAKYQEMQ